MHQKYSLSNIQIPMVGRARNPNQHQEFSEASDFMPPGSQERITGSFNNAVDAKVHSEAAPTGGSTRHGGRWLVGSPNSKNKLPSAFNLYTDNEQPVDQESKYDHQFRSSKSKIKPRLLNDKTFGAMSKQMFSN